LTIASYSQRKNKHIPATYRQTASPDLPLAQTPKFWQYLLLTGHPVSPVPVEIKDAWYRQLQNKEFSN